MTYFATYIKHTFSMWRSYIFRSWEHMGTEKNVDLQEFKFKRNQGPNGASLKENRNMCSFDKDTDKPFKLKS